MGIFFRKRIKIVPGVAINLSKSGPGLSVGFTGAHVGIGPRGPYASASLPGTGIQARSSLKVPISSRTSASQHPRPTPLNISPPEALKRKALRLGDSIAKHFAHDSLLIKTQKEFLRSQEFIRQGHVEAGLDSLEKIAIDFPDIIPQISPELGIYLAQTEHYAHAIPFLERALNQPDDIYANSYVPLKHPISRKIVTAFENKTGVGKLFFAWIYIPCKLLDRHNTDAPTAKTRISAPIVSDVQIVTTLAFSYLQVGRAKDALPLFQSLPAEIKDTLDYIICMARVFFDLKQPELAREVLETGPYRAKTMEPPHLPYRYLLGLAYQQCGERDKAIIQFRKVYAMDAKYEDIEQRMNEVGANTSSNDKQSE